MLSLQKFLFDDKPTRRRLLEYKQTIISPSYRIGVYRNHSFELIEHTIGAFLDYAEMSVQFDYSDYDDSLSFANLNQTTDLLILWLDLSRYNNLQNINGFVIERIRYLESIYPNPILFVPFAGDCSYQSERVTCFSLDSIESTLGSRFYDERMEPFSGTKMSAAACLLVSEQLGLRYLPALLKPSLKAIIVDLDNTLYQGVLGEDGIDGIVLTEGHISLQQQLKSLATQGLFLCIASKNEERDVISLFDERKDFPLRKDDFTKICANWNSKAQSIEEIARYLNINPDSMLFIDDNMGELLAVAEAFPQIKLIHALDDAQITCRILSMYPGLLRLHSHREDKLRKGDVQANAIRRRLQGTSSPEEYLRSIGTKITFSLNNAQQAARISELANKTNQFIFCYRRYSLSEVMSLIQRDDAVVVTASLSDNLSDSGIIGVCVAFKQKGFVEIDECFVSCRALGRGLDEIIVLGMFSCAIKQFGVNRLKINFVAGERNHPAGQFVEKKLHNFIESDEVFDYQVPQNVVEVEVLSN